MNHIEKRVLVVLKRRWRWHFGGNSWRSFKKLADEINRPLSDTKEAVWSLRDLGILEHAPMVNDDGVPHGSGYFLTHKGRNL